jgi:LmbE family N-acetylglucosaminyl deacetylase
MNTALEQDTELEGTFRVAVVVAHPDDEILWAGGLLLSHPEWSPFVVTLCRGSDPDRAPKFLEALEQLNAQGVMGDLDDSPDQAPLPATLVRETLLSLLPGRDFDLLITHAPRGEYTRHRRHEEVSRAVRVLWKRGDLRIGELWQFAYVDEGGAGSPRPIENADIRVPLSDELWDRKSAIITEVYGFGTDSWEARAVTRSEAFHCFSE